MAGGLAGVISCTVVYPIDVIKTIIQTSDQSRMLPVMRENYFKYGFMFFYRGLWPTLVRSFVIDGVSLVSFDYLNENFVTQF